MSNQPQFYKMLRGDKDDQMRAAALDAWLAEQPQATRNLNRYHVFCLMDEWQLSETMAKSVLYMTYTLVSAHADERDKMIAHGEAVRAAYEWELLEEVKG